MMVVNSDSLSFRAIIIAACFKISHCFSSSLFRFLSFISSRCSSARLSIVLNKPVVLACLIHLSNVEGIKSYFWLSSLRFLPVV